MPARRVSNLHGLSCLRTDIHLAFHKNELQRFICHNSILFPPLFSLPKSEDFACGRHYFVLITQIYLIYCEKDTELSEKRYRAIIRLLGIF